MAGPPNHTSLTCVVADGYHGLCRDQSGPEVPSPHHWERRGQWYVHGLCKCYVHVHVHVCMHACVCVDPLPVLAFAVSRIKTETGTSIIIPPDTERSDCIRIEGDPVGVKAAKNMLLELASKMVGLSGWLPFT